MIEDAIAAMRRLVGVWRGVGTGSYPGVPAFRYLEHTEITAARAWNMLQVVQQTWQDAGQGVQGKALHLEVGLIMARPDGELGYSCAQDSGRVEAMTGVARQPAPGSLHIAWQTTSHANDARLVKAGRAWTVTEGVLVYEARLSTVRTPEYRLHLEARLTRG